MHFTIQRDAFASALDACGRAVPAKATIPVLTTMLLEADVDGVQVTATNLETVITCRIPAEVEEVGRACLSAEQLSGFIRELGGGTVELSSNGTFHGAVSAPGARGKLIGQNPEDYPSVLRPGEARHVATMTASDLRTLLAGSVYAVAFDGTRPVLAGVQIKGAPDGMEAAAANGFICAAVQVDQVAEVFTALPDGNACRDLLAILTKAPPMDVVEIDLYGSLISFSLPTISFSCRLIDGDFPDYRRIVPVQATTKVRLEPSMLRNAIGLVAPFCGADVLVSLVIDDDGLRITGADGAADGVAEVDGAEVEGESVTVGLNRKYLAQSLGVFDRPIEVWANAPTTPVLFRTSDGTQISVHQPMHRTAKG